MCSQLEDFFTEGDTEVEALYPGEEATVEAGYKNHETGYTC